MVKQRTAHSYICVNSDSKFHKIPFPHGKNRKACNLYEPRDPLGTPQIIPEGMRLIEDLRGKEEFRNSDFWIIGSDPNLDYYLDNFFDDKFSIAINASCFAFPKSTFLYMSGKRELEWMIDKYPDCLKKVIIFLGSIKPKFSSKAKKEMPSRLPPEGGIGRWENWGLEPIYMKPENKPMTASVPDYESTIERILSDGSCDFVLTRTSIHFAVFIAAVLGAKKIILVGCSHKSLKGQAYAHKRGVDDFISGARGRRKINTYYGSQGSGITRLRRDTIQLARVFGRRGIEIVRHYFDEDRNEFVFEKIVEEPVLGEG